MQTKNCGCSACTQTNPQPVSQFYKNRGKRDGLQSRCKSCQRHAMTPGSPPYEASQRSSKKYKTTPRGIFIDRKGNAKKNNHVWTIPESFFYLLLSKPCFVSKCTDKVTGLDRIDSSKGYLIDNVRPSCVKHNTMKSDLTDLETYQKAKEFVEWYESIQIVSLPLPPQIF